MIDGHGNGFRNGKPRGGKKVTSCGVCACYFWFFQFQSLLQAIHRHLSTFSSERSGTSDRIEFKSWAWGVSWHTTSEDLESHGSIRLFDHPLAFEPIFFSWSLPHHPSNFRRSGCHPGLTHIKKKAERKRWARWTGSALGYSATSFFSRASGTSFKSVLFGLRCA